ncbi:hypothetical protein BU23DRAFT_574647 [Bimuria novae-zelandiae CBS 107.79]|uniref:Uncharacterized protein n=1 Tax=Bimuria novae-zelandiae CBS 107.79 TaxID=1447943 RepID=A0A6A5UXC1_9PLEO|nr:hypothetical protein BU23DRAFT_574647 [Bimuria novae-zelandiae CBS 107.79]
MKPLILFICAGISAAADVLVCTEKSCYATEPNLPKPIQTTGPDGISSFLIPFVWTDLVELSSTTTVITTITQTDDGALLITPTVSVVVQPKGYWWRNQLLGPPVTPPASLPESTSVTTVLPVPESTPTLAPVILTSSSTGADGVHVPVPITLAPINPPPGPGNDPPGNDPPSNDPPSNDPPSNDLPSNDPPDNDPPGSGPPSSGPPDNDPPESDPDDEPDSDPTDNPENTPTEGGSQPSNTGGGGGPTDTGAGGQPTQPPDPTAAPEDCDEPKTADRCTASCIASTASPATTLTTTCTTTFYRKDVGCTAAPTTVSEIRTKEDNTAYSTVQPSKTTEPPPPPPSSSPPPSPSPSPSPPPPPPPITDRWTIHIHHQITESSFNIEWTLTDSNGVDRNNGRGMPLTAPDFPNEIFFEVWDATDKDKTQVIWHYQGNCEAGWSTGAGEYHGQRCGEDGDFQCDDKEVDWKEYDGGVEKYFDCRIRSGL